MVETPICLSCGKYVFDSQNVNEFKRMTAEEYVEAVLRSLIRNNKSAEWVIKQFGLSTKLVTNKSECELCGAPHAVWTSPKDKSKSVRGLVFFYSGTKKASRKDRMFIEEFRSRFFSR